MRTGLELALRGATIATARRLRPDLRTPIPALGILAGAMVHGVRRRAKYLLIDCDGAVVLNHLGMTGMWRVDGRRREHDHVELRLADGRRLAFNDARRFGLLELCRADGGHPALDALGPEPLADAFTGAVLAAAAARHPRCAVKALIMDQRVVAGVGNIYASEACFRAGIRPLRSAGALARNGYDRLAEAIRVILAEAIAAGGSTIGDYRQVNGMSGRFQHRFAVYGRTGQPCQACGTAISTTAIAGRSTFWCRSCQRG